MNELQTILGTEIPLSTRGILYLCIFKDNKLTVVNELFFSCAFAALEAYANIPNPESQLVSGKTFNDLINELHQLHDDMKNPEWLKELEEML